MTIRTLEQVEAMMASDLRLTSKGVLCPQAPSSPDDEWQVEMMLRSVQEGHMTLEEVSEYRRRWRQDPAQT